MWTDYYKLCLIRLNKTYKTNIYVGANQHNGVSWWLSRMESMKCAVVRGINLLGNRRGETFLGECYWGKYRCVISQELRAS